MRKLESETGSRWGCWASPVCPFLLLVYQGVQCTQRRLEKKTEPMLLGMLTWNSNLTTPPGHLRAQPGVPTAPGPGAILGKPDIVAHPIPPSMAGLGQWWNEMDRDLQGQMSPGDSSWVLSPTRTGPWHVSFKSQFAHWLLTPIKRICVTAQQPPTCRVYACAQCWSVHALNEGCKTQPPQWRSCLHLLPQLGALFPPGWQVISLRVSFGV